MDLDTSIRTVLPVQGGGNVATMGFPGLAFDVAGQAVIAPERMQDTLNHPALEDCDLLIVLLELNELPEGAMILLQSEAVARSIAILHLPIEDYHAPDPQFERHWRELQKMREDILRKGRTIGLSCHYGAGRSGMMGAKVLIENGMSLQDAITTIRAQFPDSIESDVQMQWLESF